ncbi:MAG: T9SS type A sorting domain-containing protein [Crocinitomicaceae bacterium]|nr:T9SS type A sorting domain-containing protein [Crocinitomicaceae bacterium]
MFKFLFSILSIFFIQKTVQAQTVSDIDGNVYPTVEIGKQVWMAANLKATHFSNGDTILTTSSCYDTITDEFEPKYWWAYNCNDSLANIYGYLYTWYVADDARNVCPEGWHVPSYPEYMILDEFLGGQEISGGKLKQSGLDCWKSPNTGATNEYGYNGVPNGHRSLNGYYDGLTKVSDVWTTNSGIKGAHDFDLNYDVASTISNDDPKEFGFAIRCLRDEPSSIEVPNNLSVVTVYPIPTTDELWINTKYNSKTTFEIIALDGKSYMKGTLNIGVNQLDVRTLNAGIYIIRIIDEHDQIEIKFSKL